MAEAQQKKTLGLAIASLVLGCLFIIPCLGPVCGLTAIILGIVALNTISKNQETFKGTGLAIAGIVLGAVGTIIAVIGLLAAIAIPNLLRARTAANEASAQAIIRSIATAAETYAVSNNGQYPVSSSSLREFLPSITDYENNRVSGYSYSLNLNSSGYEISAYPVTCGVTGRKNYQIKSGGNGISETDCAR
jgi:type II secretory pathway pseudopilin PulG